MSRKSSFAKLASTQTTTNTETTMPIATMPVATISEPVSAEPVAPVVSGQASDITVADLAKTLTNLQTKKAQAERMANKEAKAAAELAAWEAKTKARNPQFVVGSLRRPSDADRLGLGHCHGMVCDITCSVCGAKRVVNKQDAFQVRRCLAHLNVGVRAAAKEKREIAKTKGMSPEVLAAKIAELQAELARVTAEPVAETIEPVAAIG